MKKTKTKPKSAQRLDNPHLGSDFDAFLEEKGILEHCEEQAAKELLAQGILEVMKSEGISKSEMARRMATSRPALDRLLDPTNESVTLRTLQRAAAALGKRLHLEIS